MSLFSRFRRGPSELDKLREELRLTRAQQEADRTQFQIQEQNFKRFAARLSPPGPPIATPPEAQEIALRENWGAGWFTGQSLFGAIVSPTAGLYDGISPLLAAVPTLWDYTLNLGFYVTEAWLDILRMYARTWYSTTPQAQGVMRGLRDYIIHTGFEYQVQPKEGMRVARSLPDHAQRIVDDFLTANGWFETEQDWFLRLHRDGEAFPILHPQDDGVTKVRTLEPWQVRGGNTSPTNTFGVYTAEGDREHITGYRVTMSGNGTDAETVLPTRMSMIKMNTDKQVKRGVSDFVAVGALFQSLTTLLQNTQVGEALRQALVWVQETTGAANPVQEMVAPGGAVPNGYQFGSPGTWGPGQIPTMDKNLQFKPGPVGDTTNATNALQLAYQALSVYFRVPEWMISGTSAANFASSLTQESPLVRMAQSEQKFLKDKYGAVVTMALRIAEEQELLEPGTVDKLELNIEATPLVVREPGQETSRNKTLADDGILSKRTWSTREDLDRDHELEMLKEEAADPDQNPPQPGQPGDPNAQPSGGGPEPAQPSGTPAAKYAQLAPRPEDGNGEADPLAALIESTQLRESKDAAGHEHKGKGKNGGQFTTVGGSGGAVSKKKDDDSEEDDLPEWDGVIEQNDVTRQRGSAEHVAEWNFVDGDQNHEQNTYIETGEYDPFPDNPDSDLVEVYRWYSQDESGYRSDEGEWVSDESDARADARRHARQNHEEPVEPEDEEEDEEEQDQSVEIPDAGTPTKREVVLGADKLPRSSAAVSIKRSVDEGTADDIIHAVFGGDRGEYTPLMESIGMPDDAEVDVVAAGKYETLFSDDLPIPGAVGVRVEVSHPKMERVSRFVGIDGDGKRFIKNEIIEIKKAHQGEGLGEEIFTRQVEAASSEGVDYITTHAAGRFGGSMNGYYTWPSFGYDQRLDDAASHGPVFDKAKKLFPDAESVLDIMATPKVELPDDEFAETKKKLEELDAKLKKPYKDRTTITGADWWKVNGSDLHNARFDLDPTSRSMAVLAARRKKAKAGTKSPSVQNKNPSATTFGSTSTKTGSPRPQVSKTKKQRAEPTALMESFDESAHPRADDGKFGVGSGDKKDTAPTKGPPTDDPKTNGPNPAFTDATRPPLDPAEVKAAVYYSGGGYTQINALLRGGSPEAPEHAQVMHEQLQKAFAKTRPLPEPVAVYRTMQLRGLPDDERGAFVVSLTTARDSGGTVTLDGYTSTTTDKAWVDRLASQDTVIEIAAHKGLDLKPYSKKPHERELLLDASSRFRVLEYHTEDVEKANGTVFTKHFIKLEQVPNG